MANDSEKGGPKPPAQPAWTLDDRAGAACQNEVAQAVDRLLALLQAGTPPPPSGALAMVNRRFGKDLSPALRATADMMQGCAPPFQYLPFCAATLRQLDVRIRVLQNSKAALDAAAGALAAEIAACRVLAGECVDASLRTVRATLDNPGAPPGLKRPLLQASGPLRALLQARASDAGAPTPGPLALPAEAITAARRGGRKR